MTLVRADQGKSIKTVTESRNKVYISRNILYLMHIQKFLTFLFFAIRVNMKYLVYTPDR